MKRIVLILTLIMVLCTATVSCSFGGTTPGGTPGGGGDEIENLIYNESTPIYCVYDPATLPSEAVIRLVEAFSDAGIYLETYGLNPTEQAHELVIGNVGRAVSDSAYTQLDRIDKNSDTDLRYCIYSSGSSVAIAFDDDSDGYCLDLAINYFIENYVKEELILKKGTAYKISFDLYEYLGELDELEFDRYWRELSEVLGAEGEDIVSALRVLYTIYDGEAILKWTANLYDNDICVCTGFYGEETCSNTQWCHTGGFYFSNSGRDTVGYLPDAESTRQALNLINSFGITKGTGGNYTKLLPEWMSERIISFVYNLQDPDGYFYHPQWGKDIIISRRGRDLSWCIDILNNYKRSPRYATILDVGGDDTLATVAPLYGRLGSSSAVAVSRVVAVESETLIPDYLQTPDKFRQFLESKDIRNNSYSVGSELSATGSQILARGPEYGEILISWLNENQYDNGTWHHSPGYDAINGVMKISGSYSRWKAEMPNAEATVRASFAAIDTEEEADGIVDVWNAWVAATSVLNNIESYAVNGKEKAAEIRKSLMPLLDEAILATREKLTVFLKRDGSFVYGSTGKTSGKSMGATVCVPGTDEGDLNATLIGSSNMTDYIFSFMKLSSYEVPLALSRERAVFLDTINNLPPVTKNGGMVEIGDPIDFELDDLGESPADVSNTGKLGTLYVVEDPRGDGNVAQLISVPGSGDCIQVPAQGSTKNKAGMVYESDICINSGSSGDTVRLELGEAGDAANIYRIVFNLSSGGIRMYDCSANNTKFRISNDLINLSYGQWFKLRVEVYNGDHSSFRAKVFIDGKLLAISDNYYDNNGTKIDNVGVPNSKTQLARFYVLANHDLDMMVDNVLCYKSSDTYVFEQLHEDYRYLSGALNVDNYSTEGVIYDMEELELGTEGLPAEFTVSGTGAAVAQDGQNKYLALSNGVSVSIPYTKRAQSVNNAAVSFKLLPSSYSAGDGVKISLIDSEGGVIFFLTARLVEVGGNRVFKLYGENGNPIDGVEHSADEAFSLRIVHYPGRDTALIYVDEKRVGFYATEDTVMQFARAELTAIGSVKLDDIVSERDFLSFDDATAPETPNKVYDFSAGYGDITYSGNGVSIRDLALNLKGGTSASAVKVPVFERDTVVGYTELGFTLTYSASPAGDAGTHLIALTDSDGAAILAFTLKYSQGTVTLHETTEEKVYEQGFGSFKASDVNTLRICYFEKEGTVKVYVNDTFVYNTYLLYNSDASSRTPAYLAVNTVARVSSTVEIDDLYVGRYNKLYLKEKLSYTAEDAASVLTFESIGGISLPTLVSPNIVSSAPDPYVVESVINGEATKVLRFETVSAASQDNLIIRTTSKTPGAVSYVFEADVMLESAVTSAPFQFYMWQGGAKNMEINIGASGSRVMFEHKDHLTQKRSSIDVANVGEWFRLRVEYYTTTEGGAAVPRMKVFINGELLYVTDFRMNDSLFTTIDYASFYCPRSGQGVILLDNVSLSQSTEAYDGTPLTEGFVAGVK